LVALLAFSCVDPQGVSQDVQKRAKGAADEVVEKATDKGKEVIADGIDGAKAEAKALWEDVPGTGELSATTRGWLDAATGDGVEPLVAKGTQLAPVALEIGKVVDDAVDKDYAIEPIYQEVGDEAARARLDEKLAKMPKTQEIDGVRVGFKRLSEVSSEKKVDESAYLVLWRRDDHLVGFVYRTRSEIDVDKLAAEAPRLVGLVNGALESHG
jgi:hypothetical protein